MGCKRILFRASISLKYGFVVPDLVTKARAYGGQVLDYYNQMIYTSIFVKSHSA